MSDDLIRRSDAIEAVENVTWYHQNCNKDMVEGANSDEHQAWYKSQDIYEALEAVPSAEITADDVLEYCRPRLLTVIAEEALPSADRPQGEWIKPKNEIAIRLNQWICSNCNYLVDGKHNFCPNCGADMRKGADDEIVEIPFERSRR